MIKIAVCDDEEIGIKCIFKLLNSVKEEMEMELHGFRSAYELLEGVRTTHFDLIYLDIEMDGMDGIEAGKIIRKMEYGYDSRIIFVTSHKEMAVDSFEAEPFHFIVKPIEPEPFLHIFRKALFTLQRNPRYFTYQKVWGEVGRYPLNKISVFVSNSRKVELKGMDFQDVFPGRLNDVEKQLRILNAEWFLRIHRCVIINLDHVVSFKKGILRVDVGLEDITISRTYEKEATQRLMEYHRRIYK